MPEDAIQDKFDYVFIYEKNGVKKEFPMTALPDSTWKFSERKQTLVEKGKNNVPLINDFSLTDTDGNDHTDSVLNIRGEYYLVFIKELPGDGWVTELKRISADATAQAKKIYVVTAQREAIEKFLAKNDLAFNNVFTCDATAIKTAARTDLTLYMMKGPVVQGKWAGADLNKVK